MPILVLKRFKIDETAPDMVIVEGRNAGLLSWFLNAIGVDYTTSLRCTKDKIVYKRSSIFGKVTMTIPLQSITAVIAGTKKPKQLLGWAVLVFGGAISLAVETRQNMEYILGTGALITIGLLIAYALSKSMGIFVQNGSDTEYGLQFKASVVENVPVNSAKVNRAIDIINRAVLRQFKVLPDATIDLD